MKVSIVTGIVNTYAGSKGLRDQNESLRMLHEAGFRTIDLSLANDTKANFILNHDDWKKRIEELGNTAASLGMEFKQCHLPYLKGTSKQVDPRFKNNNTEKIELFNTMVRRAYEACGMLGIPWATAHPLTIPTVTFGDVQLANSREFYDPFVEWGIRCGVGTAFENMRPDESYLVRRYCEDYHDLIALVDSYNDPMVGICWDTGHANGSQVDQVAAIHAMGARIKSLHINDNYYSARDQHMLPFMGEIDWESVMKALADVNYQGVLNYEVGRIVRTAPTELQKAVLPLIYRNCCQLLEIYEKYAAQREEGGVQA